MSGLFRTPALLAADALVVDRQVVEPGCELIRIHPFEDGNGSWVG